MISQYVLNVRAETRDGVKYLVASVVMVVPGVLAGFRRPAGMPVCTNRGRQLCRL